MAKKKTKSKQSLGGEARAKKLTQSERSAVAKRAAIARWGGPVPEVLCGSSDKPLRIGDTEIPCYVLEDERRVLVQRGMLTALNMAQGTAGRGDGDRLARFLATKSVNPFVNNDLRDVITSPIRFKIGANEAYGYEATILADICEAVLAARRSESGLNYQQEHIARQCEILLASFARVGIIALVDEATGFQYVRQRDALSQLLEEFLSEELRDWVRTFPASYFQELCRLRGVQFRSDMRLPQYFGHLTNDIVYKRLHPRVLKELQNRTGKNEDGSRPNKLHQYINADRGKERLDRHLGLAIGLMRVSDTYDGFKKMLDTAAPVPQDLPLLDAVQDD